MLCDFKLSTHIIRKQNKLLTSLYPQSENQITENQRKTQTKQNRAKKDTSVREDV